MAAFIPERALHWSTPIATVGGEPGGDEVLSPARCEAALMGEAVGAHRAWFDRFLPRAAAGEPATLFTPARVSDRTDGKIAHLDGLNLGRAWFWRRIARSLGSGRPAQDRLCDAADRHLAASLRHLADDDRGAHWLASVALLALLA